MNRNLIYGAVGALLLGASTAKAVIYDSVNRARIRYGDPIFATVLEGRQTLTYKLDQLYVTQTYNEEYECEKVIYRRQDKCNLAQDDFELIFRSENAQQGTVLSLSSPTIRFLQFDNQKVARVSLSETTFFSRAEFRSNYGRIPTQDDLNQKMKERVAPVNERVQLAAKRRKLAAEAENPSPPVEAIVPSAPPPAPVQPKPYVSIQPTPNRNNGGRIATLILGLLLGAAGAVVAYFMLTLKIKHPAPSSTTAPPKPQAEEIQTKLEHPRLKKPEAGREPLPQQESPRLVLRRK